MCIRDSAEYMGILFPFTKMELKKEIEWDFERPRCTLHPGKTLDYVCLAAECERRLFCATCLLKKDACEHDESIDVEDFLNHLGSQQHKFGLAGTPEIASMVLGRATKVKAFATTLRKEQDFIRARFDELLTSTRDYLTRVRDDLLDRLQAHIDVYTKHMDALAKLSAETFGKTSLAAIDLEDVIEERGFANDEALRSFVNSVLEFHPTKFEVDPSVERKYKTVLAYETDRMPVEPGKFDEINEFLTLFQENVTSTLAPLLKTSEGHAPSREQSKTQFSRSRAEKVSESQEGPRFKGAESTLAARSTTETKHLRQVYCILRLDENEIATSADDGLIKLWELRKLTSFATLRGHTAGIRCMVLLGSGLIASGSWDKTIRLWARTTEETKGLAQVKPELFGMTSPMRSRRAMSTEGETSQEQRACLFAPAPVLCLHEVAAGETALLASGCSDYMVRLWNTETKELVKTFSGHTGEVLALVGERGVSSGSTGELLVSGSGDRTIKLWSVARKLQISCTKTLYGHTDSVWTLVLLEDDTTLVSGSLDKTIRVWDVKRGELLRMMKTGQSHQPMSLVPWRTHYLVSGGSDGTLKLWSLVTYEFQRTITHQHRGSVFALTALDDGFASSGADKLLVIWK
eukprot:TRINITY_DN14198_c0_g2_i1.p1 TRINITY_DN14198_c0_g2~~TRINITY_DN14198_c0_g2_i1.p1  ORF type:complete len:633 (+),score=114.25 TRINITY_DN14198_c0_g2_i1:65-1963(+)